MTDSRSQHSSTGKAPELASIMQSATQCVDRLLDLMVDEREALSTGNIEAIDQCGKSKAECVVQLEALDSKRAKLCRELGLSNSEIDDFLNQQQTVDVPNQWEAFLVKLESCREANTVNGSFARIRKGHVEKALQILRGFPNAPGLYGPNGLDDPKDVTNLGQA